MIWLKNSSFGVKQQSLTQMLMNQVEWISLQMETKGRIALK